MSDVFSVLASSVMRRNSSIFDKLEEFASVLKRPESTAALQGDDEDEHAGPLGAPAGAAAGGGDAAPGATAAGGGQPHTGAPRRRKPVVPVPTGPPEPLKKEVFPHWLTKRDDFNQLKSEQENGGPKFVLQALSHDGAKRTAEDIRILEKWLRQYPKFANWTPDQLRTVCRALQHVHIEPGQTVYPEKRALYIILSGRMEVVKPGFPAQTLGPRDALGARMWWSMVADGVQQRSARVGRRMSKILTEAETQTNQLGPVDRELMCDAHALWSPTDAPSPNNMTSSPAPTGDAEATPGFGATPNSVVPLPSDAPAPTSAKLPRGPLDRTKRIGVLKAAATSFRAPYSSRALTMEEGGDANGVDCVRLAASDYVDALQYQKRQETQSILNFLQGISYFSTWTHSRLLLLAGLLECRSVPAGQAVYEEGESVDSFCFVRTGKCEMRKRVPITSVQRYPKSSHRWVTVKKTRELDVLVRVLGPKDVFGEEGVLVPRKVQQLLVDHAMQPDYKDSNLAELFQLDRADASKPGGNSVTMALRALRSPAKPKPPTRAQRDDSDNSDSDDTDDEKSDAATKPAKASGASTGPKQGHSGGVGGGGGGAAASLSKSIGVFRGIVKAKMVATDALKHIREIQRPYTVMAVEDSQILYLRPEFFYCLYHTDLIKELKNLAKCQLPRETVEHVAKSRDQMESAMREMKYRNAGPRYLPKIEEHLKHSKGVRVPYGPVQRLKHGVDIMHEQQTLQHEAEEAGQLFAVPQDTRPYTSPATMAQRYLTKAREGPDAHADDDVLDLELPAYFQTRLMTAPAATSGGATSPLVGSRSPSPSFMTEPRQPSSIPPPAAAPGGSSGLGAASETQGPNLRPQWGTAAPRKPHAQPPPPKVVVAPMLSRYLKTSQSNRLDTAATRTASGRSRAMSTLSGASGAADEPVNPEFQVQGAAGLRGPAAHLAWKHNIDDEDYRLVLPYPSNTDYSWWMRSTAVKTGKAIPTHETPEQLSRRLKVPMKWSPSKGALVPVSGSGGTDDME